MNRLHLATFCRAGLALSALTSALALAQPLLGVTSQGNTGGLVLPTADVLTSGSLALSYGNYQDQALGPLRPVHQNASLGVGLLPGLEFFGRFAEYTMPNPGSIIVNGTRDISANIKYQLPQFWPGLPKLALGVNDLSGGAVFFQSAYAVATQNLGPLGLTLGYAKGENILGGAASNKVFDGPFGALNFRFAEHWSALAELQQNQRHLGLRWMSDELPALAHGRLVAQVQRDSNRYNWPGADGNANSFNVSLVLPFGVNDARDQRYQPGDAVALPAVELARPASPAPQVAPVAALDAMAAQLTNLGLEHVRVGSVADAVVIEYENHRYAQNDVDAVGLVLGVAAELAGRGVARIHAVATENGQTLYETTAQVAVYRQFLRSGDSGAMGESLHWSTARTLALSAVQWAQSQPGPAARLRVTLRPELRTTLGTEIGAFDYALAANLQAVLPLWTGGQMLATGLTPLGNSPNMAPDGIFAVFRPRDGLKTLALQQNFKLGDNWRNRVSVGRFQFDANGAEIDSVLQAPWANGEWHAQGAWYDRIPGSLFWADRAGSISYRHALAPAHYLAVGAHQFTDGSRGPSLEWTRWYGDVGVQLFFRKGGATRFAGLELTFPLTPRQGMKPGSVFLGGTGHHPQAVRTRLTDAASPGNYITPGGVSPLRLELGLDESQRNAGRVSQAYWLSQVGRMREAFYSYAASGVLAPGALPSASTR